MTKYVVGFLFDKSIELVVLIEKQKPEWQKNKWNGVGGKIETEETPLQAMVREFKEEAGLEINDWRQYCIICGNNFEIYIFYSIVEAEHLMRVRTMTDENIGVWSLARVNIWNFPLLPDMRWILPMAIVAINEKRTENYKILVNHGTK